MARGKKVSIEEEILILKEKINTDKEKLALLEVKKANIEKDKIINEIKDMGLTVKDALAFLQKNRDLIGKNTLSESEVIKNNVE